MGKLWEAFFSIPEPEPMEASEVDRRLALLRDCCQFYLKVDFAVFAAAGAIISFLGWRDDALVFALSDYRWIFLYMVFLVIYGLMFEMDISKSRILSSMTISKPDPIVIRDGLKKLRRAYQIQVWGHLVAFLCGSGFVAGAVAKYTELSRAAGAG